MKTVTAITDENIIETLKYASRLAPQPYVRERAHAVLLSNRGFSVTQIAIFFDIQYQTVSRWLDDWEKEGLSGLYKCHSGGRSPIYDEQEVERAKQLISEEPRRISYTQAALEKETKKKASQSTITRIAKKCRLVYKRVRRSCKHKRNEAQFSEMKQALKSAQLAADNGLINLFYFDESGFSQQPCIPYAWQPIGEQLRIPSVKSKRINVLGFMSKNNDLFTYSTTERVDSKKVIEAFEEFAEKMKLPQFGFGKRTTLVIVDNAKIHTSAAFKSQLEKWKVQDNLIVCYLPTYSPELNLIEILWGNVK